MNFLKGKIIKKKKVKIYLAIDVIDFAFAKRYTALQFGDSSPCLKALSSQNESLGIQKYKLLKKKSFASFWLGWLWSGSIKSWIGIWNIHE